MVTAGRTLIGRKSLSEETGAIFCGERKIAHVIQYQDFYSSPIVQGTLSIRYLWLCQIDSIQGVRDI